jgi:hypothetical protein
LIGTQRNPLPLRTIAKVLAVIVVHSAYGTPAGPSSVIRKTWYNSHPLPEAELCWQESYLFGLDLPLSLFKVVCEKEFTEYCRFAVGAKHLGGN